jgi:microcystin degradation protein MlrC
MGSLAQEIGQWYWDHRAAFLPPTTVRTLPWRESVAAMRHAASSNIPIFVADGGDSASAGASGDVPFVCRQLLALEAATVAATADTTATTDTTASATSTSTIASATSAVTVSFEAGPCPNPMSVLIAGLVDAAAVTACTEAGAGTVIPSLAIGAASEPFSLTALFSRLLRAVVALRVRQVV